MLPTRSQDLDSHGAELNYFQENQPASIISKRRKIDHASRELSGRHSPLNGRTKSQLVAIVVPALNASTYGKCPPSEQLSGQQEEEHSRENPSISSVVGNNTADPNNRVTTTFLGTPEMSAAEKERDPLTDGVSGSHEFKESATSVAAALKATESVAQNGRKLHREASHYSDRPSERATSTGVALAGDFSKKTEDELSLTVSIKATHKRFGSEDLEGPGLQLRNLSSGNRAKSPTPEGVAESEDEAPDAVTASAGFNQARAAAAESARITERLEEAQRSKRREHDLRMKLQAKSTQKGPQSSRSSKTDTPTPAVADDEDIRPRAEIVEASKTSLPALLSDEILAAEPSARLLKPPSSTSKPQIKQKLKLLNTEQKPPKDLKRGNTKIRVLPVDRDILPPRPSQASKSLREAWLLGQRGSKGGAGVSRRYLTKGFIRSGK